VTLEDLSAIRARAAAHADAAADVAEPIEVRDAHGVIRSWFVPIIDGDRIAGFVELDIDLRHRRTSMFGRGSGSNRALPAAASWIDPDAVLERARPQLSVGDVPGVPYLSFDGVPDRIAWAVPVSRPTRTYTIYVAGDAAWIGTGSAGLEDG
jgi:hypothetical protein